MTLLTKKITTAALSLAMIGGAILSCGFEIQKDNINLEAAYSTNVKVYLDKSFVVNTANDWWITDETYIHIWDGMDTWQQMTKLSDTIFTWELTTANLNGFIDSSRGFEFYVFNKSVPQNIMKWVPGDSFKTNEKNYFSIKSIYVGSNQDWLDYTEISAEKANIEALSCSSTSAQVSSIVSLYSDFSTTLKTTLKTDLIPSTSTTYFSRLDYMAVDAGVTRPE